jgi:hypothetical protein
VPHFEVVNKARALRSQCPSRESWGRRDGGPTAGEQHGEQLPCAGSLAVEGIPISASTSPFAGRRRSKDLGWLGASEGSLQPFAQSSRSTTTGCSSSLGGGAPLPTSSCGVARRGKGRSFAPGGSAHAAHRRRSAVSGATAGGVVLSPASGVTTNGDLQRSPYSASLHLPRIVRRLGPDVARCPLISREMGIRSSCSSKELARRAGQTQRVPAPKADQPNAGEDWTLEGRARASLSLLQKSIGGVGPRKPCALHFTRSGERVGTAV